MVYFAAYKSQPWRTELLTIIEARGQDGSQRQALQAALRSKSAHTGHVTRSIQSLNMAIVGKANVDEIYFISSKLVEAYMFDDAHDLVVKYLEDINVIFLVLI